MPVGVAVSVIGRYMSQWELGIIFSTLLSIKLIQN